METLVDPWFVLCPQKILHVTCKLVSCMVKWVKPSKFTLRPSTYSFLPLYCRMIVCAIMRWLTETTTFYNLTNPLLIYTWFLNNQYGKIKSISDWIFTQGRRNVWGHKDWSSPCFQDSVNPISTRGADYAHHSTTVLTMIKYVPAALLLPMLPAQIQFVELDFSNLNFQNPSTDQQGERKLGRWLRL